MKNPFLRSNGGAQSPALLFAALGLVALVPAVCVLWFMSIAMRNERLAVEERLREAYSNQLVVLKGHCAEWVHTQQTRLAPAPATSAPVSFASLVRANVADAFILYDSAAHPLYPSLASAPDPKSNTLLLRLRSLDKNDPRYRSTLDDLTTGLNDYAVTELPASQRRFLMREVLALDPSASFPTLAAEDLAADFLEGEPPASPFPDGPLQRTALDGVWRITSGDGAVVALFREVRLKTELARQFAPDGSAGVQIKFLPPGSAFAAAPPVRPLEIGEVMPGWRIALTFVGSDPFADASDRQTRFYLWAGVLVVASITLVAFFVARYVSAQMRLARLKNELVSTVSHELKTPLASMRALVDTLLAGRYRDAMQLQDYLRLVGKETMRLSQLIENFLTFSRMERGRQQFNFSGVVPAAIVRVALDALTEKLNAPSCLVTTHVASDLPLVHGDPDALSTVLINLIDNACKYTGEVKRIAVRVYRQGSAAVFEVADNGIGIPDAERRKIFERFYQVDQSLTRQRGGCGLGLSIVDYIVKAHGGSIEIESEPGRGSTFRVKLPIGTPNAHPAALHARVCTTE